MLRVSSNNQISELCNIGYFLHSEPLFWLPINVFKTELKKQTEYTFDQDTPCKLFNKKNL